MGDVMKHSDGNGRTFISLNTAQFIVSIIALIITIIGLSWGIHSSVYASVKEDMKLADTNVINTIESDIEKHDVSTKSHSGLREQRDKDMARLEKKIDELTVIVGRIDKKVR